MAGPSVGVSPTLSHVCAVPACWPGVPGPVTLAVTRPFTVERVTGIEPALSAWEAEVLPLNYTREGPPDLARDPEDRCRASNADQHTLSGRCCANRGRCRGGRAVRDRCGPGRRPRGTRCRSQASAASLAPCC